MVGNNRGGGGYRESTSYILVFIGGGSRGGVPGDLGPSLFLGQTEARRGKKKFFETGPPDLISESG